MKTNKLLLAVAALFAAGTAFGAIRAVTPAAWNGDPACWQQKRHAEKMAAVKGGGAKVVFIGDSITHFWETKGKEQAQKYFSEGDMKMLNLGTSADRTEHVLWRLDNGELDGYEAKCVLLMIGTNNREPVEDIAKGVRRVLDVIARKQPQAKTLLLPIFVRGEGPNNARRIANEQVNAIIKGYADGDKVIWCDFNAKFLDEKGDTQWIMRDRLHPGDAGYKIWTESVLPYFKKICGK